MKRLVVDAELRATKYTNIDEGKGGNDFSVSGILPGDAQSRQQIGKAKLALAARLASAHTATGGSLGDLLGRLLVRGVIQVQEQQTGQGSSQGNDDEAKIGVVTRRGIHHITST